jgi:hypothetical protein
MSIVLDPVQIRAQKEYIQDLVERVLGQTPVHWRYSAYSNEHFPFRACASTVRGTDPDGDEAVVIAIAWQNPKDGGEDRLIVSADILDGEGAILAEGPRYEVPTPAEALVLKEPSAAATQQVHAAMQKIGEWLRGEASTICQALA